MKPIEFLKNTNTVLIFILLLAALLVGGYAVYRSRKPIDTLHVSVDSLQLHKK